MPRLPKELPRFSYSHISTPKSQFWYPVPALESQHLPMLQDQTQYLYCVTTRAFLFVGHGVVAYSWERPLKIEDSKGDLAGVLFPHGDEDKKRFLDHQEPCRIELVAIAKGWTIIMKEGSSASEGSAAAGPMATEVPEGEESDREDSGSDGPWWAYQDLDAEFERPEYWNESRDDCYFVLWIKWKNGVAYRQASGCVRTEMWEKYKEEEPIELIMG